MTRYRIIKEKAIYHTEKGPEVEHIYVIQKWKFITWLDMYFDNYPGERMCFGNFDKTNIYLKKLKVLK